MTINARIRISGRLFDEYVSMFTASFVTTVSVVYVPLKPS